MPERPRTRLAAVRDTAGAAAGAVLGLAPHVLHHVGLIAGTAFVAGAGGNALLYLVGLIFSLPMLLRIRRRFSSWLAPGIGVLIFTALFLLSALVVGPALNSRGAGGVGPGPQPAPTVQHSQHHN